MTELVVVSPIRPPTATVSPSCMVIWVCTTCCEKEGVRFWVVLPVPLLRCRSRRCQTVTVLLIDDQRHHAAGIHSRIHFRVMPVLTPEMFWVKALVPPCCSGVPTWEVSTGTCVPTLMEAGMLSVAIRLGSERM